MFRHTDPCRDLALQQSIFGSRTAPEPTFRERLGRFLGASSRKSEPAPERSIADGAILKLLLAELPEIASDVVILEDPDKLDELPESFMIITDVPGPHQAVQIELFMKDMRDARRRLLDITSRLEKGTLRTAKAGLSLISDRMIVHNPSMPGRKGAACHVRRGRPYAGAQS